MTECQNGRWMRPKFCETCGLPLTKDRKLWHDAYTGEAVYDGHCTSEACGHYGIEHDWEFVERPKEVTSSHFFGLKKVTTTVYTKWPKCKKCGEEDPFSWRL